MSSLDLPQYICEFLDHIMKVNDFNSMELKPETCKGSASELHSIKITKPLCDKKLKVLLLKCKIASSDENRRKNFLANTSFSRESVFYDKIVPMFMKFQEEKNLSKNDQFLPLPKCYGTLTDHVNEQYAIALEDLQQHGFRMWNVSVPVPIENMRLLMRELGKFHGISFALKDQRPDEFAEFRHLTDTYGILTQSKVIRERFNDSFDRAVNSLKKENHKNIVRDVKENFSSYLEYCVNNRTSDRFAVLSHGKNLLKYSKIYGIFHHNTRNS